LNCTRTLQRDILGGAVLPLLAGPQHVVEGDVGVEGELVRRADILAHLPQHPIRLLHHDRRGGGGRRWWGAGGGLGSLGVRNRHPRWSGQIEERGDLANGPH
jgi:hypothetical protein